MNLRFDPSTILLYIAASVERYLRCHTSGCTSPIPRNEGMPELWRSLKYEDIYLRAYATGSEARLGIGRWIAGYNTTRPHQALGYRTPDEVYKSPPVAGPVPTSIDVAA